MAQSTSPQQANLANLWGNAANRDRLRAASSSRRAAVLLFLHERPGLRSVLLQDSPQLEAAFHCVWNEFAEVPAHLSCQVSRCVSNISEPPFTYNM